MGQYEISGSNRKFCLPPIVDERTRLLVLGSLPGDQSLGERRYYANPRNQLWGIIGRLIACPLVDYRYARRLEICKHYGIGFWDVLESAERSQSLDSQLRRISANDLISLATTLPSLRAIGFNGVTAARIGRRSLQDRSEWTLIDLPSTSPAYTLAYDKKLSAWQSILPHIHFLT